MRTTQRKGDYAVARAIAAFTKASMDVSLPLTESAAYDIVVDNNGCLYRVQVRYVSGREVELRRIHSNSRGYIVKKTNENAYDWLYILNSSDEEFLIKKCLSGRRSIRTQDIHKIENLLIA